MTDSSGYRKAKYERSKSRKAEIIQRLTAKGQQIAAELQAAQVPFSTKVSHIETRYVSEEKLILWLFRTTVAVPQTFEVVDSAYWLVDRMRTYFEHKELVRYNAKAPYLERDEEEIELVYLDTNGNFWRMNDQPVLVIYPDRRSDRTGKGTGLRPFTEDDFSCLDGQPLRERSRSRQERSAWGPMRWETIVNGRDPSRPATEEWGKGLDLALDRLRANVPTLGG